MAVPKSKRKVGNSEFVHQGKIVWKETQRLMRKWPKSRQITEVQFILKTAYDVHEKAVWANRIFCIMPNECATRLTLLEEAYGKINVLASFCDDWYEDAPTVRNKREKVEDGQETYVPVLTKKQIENYAGTLSQAMGVFSGAIKYVREKLKTSLENYPNFQLTLPIVEAELVD